MRISQSVNYPFCVSYLFYELITRLILITYALKYSQISHLNLFEIIPAGFINDLVSLIYILPIFFAYKSFATLFNKQLSIGLDILGFCFFSLIIYLTSISEIIFWDEFSTRFNFIAVDYLVYTHEIIGTVKESIPLFAILLGAFIFLFISLKLSIKSIIKTNSNFDFKKNLILCAASLLLCILQFNFYSSQKIQFSDNAYVCELNKNGIYELFSAFRRSSLDYVKFYPTLDNDKALDIVKAQILQPNQKFIEPNASSIVRTNLGNAKAKPKHSVVMIVVESLSAEFMQKFGNTANITPYLDKLADESIFFTNFYATGTRTIRGLEALLLSVPPTPGTSIIRRPNRAPIFNASSIFKNHGYDVSFIYGGFGYFDNMFSFFSNNNYHFIDRSNLQSNEITFANVWGVADEDIFNKSLKYFDSIADKPFFSVVLTTSNHRPYDFPEGRIDLKSGSNRYAAVKYTDYAIGRFIEEAKTKPWFNNTIFVIVADHCASSAGKTNLPVAKYHIPLFIYAPNLIAPKIVKSLSSQIDVLPTILGILGLDYTTKFFGTDILNYQTSRAFIATYQMLGYLKNNKLDNKLVILAPQKKPNVYDIKAGGQTLTEQFDQNIVDEAIAFYQSACQLYTNKQMLE
jgi:phosphoglycerol transferase MdoB-like AlkP superfamily enzyme